MNLDKTIKGIILKSGKTIMFDEPVLIQFDFRFNARHRYTYDGQVSIERNSINLEEKPEEWNEHYIKEEEIFLIVETKKKELYEFKNSEIAAIIRNAEEYKQMLAEFHEQQYKEKTEEDVTEEVTNI